MDSYQFHTADGPAAPARNIWSVAVEDAIEAGYAEWVVVGKVLNWLRDDGRIY
jgi:hypothetical protein